MPRPGKCPVDWEADFKPVASSRRTQPTSSKIAFNKGQPPMSKAEADAKRNESLVKKDGKYRVYTINDLDAMSSTDRRWVLADILYGDDPEQFLGTRSCISSDMSDDDKKRLHKELDELRIVSEKMRKEAEEAQKQAEEYDKWIKRTLGMDMKVMTDDLIKFYTDNFGKLFGSKQGFTLITKTFAQNQQMLFTHRQRLNQLIAYVKDKPAMKTKQEELEADLKRFIKACPLC